MRYFSIYILTVLCVFTVYSSAFSESLVITHDMQYEYACLLFDEKDYETAIVEFKRFVHFFPQSFQKEAAEFKIGQCLFYTKKYHDAARIFNQIILAEKDPDLVRQSVFLQSRAFIHQNNPGYAQLVLHNYLKLTEDTAIKDQIYFNLAMIQISEARKGKPESLDQALGYLEKISPDNAASYAADNRIALVHKAKQGHKKNPTLAGVLSVIPGGGLAYCGRYKDAAVTFLLNVGLMVATWQAWENDNEALAGVIGFVETGFYSANIYSGVSSAHKYNRAQIIQILNQQVYIQPKIDPETKGASLTLNFPF